MTCTTCDSYFAGRASALAPAVADLAIKRGISHIELVDGYKAAVHQRHLDGLPLSSPGVTRSRSAVAVAAGRFAALMAITNPETNESEAPR